MDPAFARHGFETVTNLSLGQAIKLRLSNNNNDGTIDESSTSHDSNRTQRRLEVVMNAPDNQREQLKQHFAKRVTNQARVVLDAWQQWRDTEFNDPRWLQDLREASEKLEKYAARFEVPQHQAIAGKISQLFNQPELEQAEPTAEQRTQLAGLMDELAANTQRKTDQEAQTAPRTFLRAPIYLAFNNVDSAQRIIKQMDFFGFRGQQFDNGANLIETSLKSKPQVIVIDVDFGGDTGAGIELVRQIQSAQETPIPVLFVCEREVDLATRLQAVRCGGEEFFTHSVDSGQLIEKIECYARANPQEPYRVLVVDDSKAQAAYMDLALKKAGMTPHVINDPMQLLFALDEFQPEIIIMDMYMPGCMGMELAKVIRQQDRFVGVPIIYISAEDDINKQLHAMSLGGDDFLTKPINPRHLVATLNNRGRRARTLQSLMIRDSLTELYTHTHTLHLLEAEIAKAQQGAPLTLALMDIDEFQAINESYGYPIGDRVLKSLALFLKQRLRKSDHCGRFGGEEFALVLTNTSESDARHLLNEIRERFGALRQPAGGQEFQVTFSCGLAQSRGESARALVDRARAALREAKNDGRNTVRVHRDSSPTST